MLKLNYQEPDKVLDISEEISSDVEKLNKITYRFSKIGAKPELTKQNVIEELKQVTSYFERRLPQTGKKVDLGPSYKDVTKKYAGQAGADKSLAEKVKKGGQGVWGPIPMPPNPNVPDADLAAMIKFVLAQK